MKEDEEEEVEEGRGVVFGTQYGVMIQHTESERRKRKRDTNQSKMQKLIAYL